MNVKIMTNIFCTNFLPCIQFSAFLWDPLVCFGWNKSNILEKPFPDFKLCFIFKPFGAL